jgi:hypothetical protein
MAINYEALNNRVTTSIMAHLLNVDAVPPSTDITALAKELTVAVFAELTAAGLSQQLIEHLREPATMASAGRAGR